MGRKCKSYIFFLKEKVLYSFLTFSEACISMYILVFFRFSFYVFNKFRTNFNCVYEQDTETMPIGDELSRYFSVDFVCCESWVTLESLKSKKEVVLVTREKFVCAHAPCTGQKTTESNICKSYSPYCSYEREEFTKEVKILPFFLRISVTRLTRTAHTLLFI